MLFQSIIKDMTQAMKDQDKFKLSVLRMLKSALQLEQINKKSDLTDDEVIKLIKKQVKMRKDSITEFEKYGKQEEIETLRQEIEVLSEYLPEELSEEEIKKGLDEIFSEINPSSIKDMGKVMKEAQEKFGSSVDTALVSKMVKERLS